MKTTCWDYFSARRTSNKINLFSLQCAKPKTAHFLLCLAAAKNLCPAGIP